MAAMARWLPASLAAATPDVGDRRAAHLTTYFHLQVHSMALSSQGSRDGLRDDVGNVEFVAMGDATP